MNRLLCSFIALFVFASTGCAQTSGSSNPNEPLKAPTSYEECVAQGNKVLKSYPGQCVTKEGLRFFQPVKRDHADCKNLCGNGTCEEIVCMAVGCPCAESVATCPQDCRE